MVFATYSGKLSPSEVEQLLKFIDLYSAGKVLRAKPGNLPNTHKVDDLSDKSNGAWKQYLK